MKYKLPFDYKDRQIGLILKAGQEFEVLFLIDNSVAIKCEGHEGYPLEATIFKLFAEIINP